MKKLPSAKLVTNQIDATMATEGVNLAAANDVGGGAPDGVDADATGPPIPGIDIGASLPGMDMVGEEGMAGISGDMGAIAAGAGGEATGPMWWFLGDITTRLSF